MSKDMLPVPNAGRNIIHIAHITDIHVALNYKMNSSAACGEPSCCWTDEVRPQSPDEACGYWGDHGGDTPPVMVDFLFGQAANMNLSAVYATGDDPSH